MKWQDKLTKPELKHVVHDAGCKTLAQFKQNRISQKDMAKSVAVKTGVPVHETCMQYRQIAVKLGLEK